jgi:hypothetical protein
MKSKDRYNYLRWKLLEYKLMYYAPEKVHSSRHKELTILDVEYDSYEQEMLALDKDLGYNNGKVLEFPYDKPSGRLVMDKLGRDKNAKSN